MPFSASIRLVNCLLGTDASGLAFRQYWDRIPVPVFLLIFVLANNATALAFNADTCIDGHEASPSSERREQGARGAQETVVVTKMRRLQRLWRPQRQQCG